MKIINLGEELLLRKAQNARYVECLDRRRKDNYAREQNKWKKMEKEEEEAETYWQKQREYGAKSKRNSSNLPYNMLTLMYNDDQGRHIKILLSLLLMMML